MKPNLFFVFASCWIIPQSKSKWSPKKNIINNISLLRIYCRANMPQQKHSSLPMSLVTT